MGRQGETWEIQRGGRRFNITPGAVVAADGAASLTARLAGWPSQALMAGVQMQVPLARPLERTLVYLEPAIRHGYALALPPGPGRPTLAWAAGCRPSPSVFWASYAPG